MPGAGSGTVVQDGTSYRLYTTHPDVRVYFSRRANREKQKDAGSLETVHPTDTMVQWRD
jgi:hypothetical protein